MPNPTVLSSDPCSSLYNKKNIYIYIYIYIYKRKLHLQQATKTLSEYVLHWFHWFLEKSIFLKTQQPPEAFYKKGVLKDFAKFTGNTCAGVSFSIKLDAEGQRLTILFKKRL